MPEFITVKSNAQILKSLGGRQNKEGLWKIPSTQKNREWLHKFKYPFQEEVVADKKELTHRLKDTLYPYQREAVEFLINSPETGSLLYLSPGLGTGLVSIVAMESLGYSRVLILALKSLIDSVWVSERDKWVQDKSKWSLITTLKEPLNEVNVVSLDYFIHNVEHFSKVHWDLVIADESILLSNRATKRYKQLKKLSRHKIWLLSGNPIRTGVQDLWSQMNLIHPTAFTSYWRFVEEYCVMQKETFGYEILGDNPAKDIVLDYSDLIFRRMMQEVLPDLPELLVQEIDLDMTAHQKKMYKQAQNDFLIELEDGRELEIPTRMTFLLRADQILQSPANLGDDQLSSKQEFILDLLRNNLAPLPMLIFVTFLAGGHQLKREIEALGYKVGFAHGEDKTGIQLYKDGTIDILILSLSVGRLGHTLTTTKTMVHLGRDYSADNYLQSVHRVRRLTLTHRPYHYILRNRGTVDDLIDKVLEGKMESISRLASSDFMKYLGKRE